MAKSLKNTFHGFTGNEDEFVPANMLDAVDKAFNDLIQRLKENLKKAKHGDDEGDSNLGASIVTFPFVSGSNILIELRMEDYYKNVDEGTKPKGLNDTNLKQLQPKIYDWIKHRPKLIRVAMEMQRKKKIKSQRTAERALSYAIATNILKKGTIKRFGYKGSRFLSKEIDNGGNTWEKLLASKISKALGQDVIVQFKIIAEDFK